MKLAHIIVIAAMLIIGVLTFRDMNKPYEHDLTFEVRGASAIVRGGIECGAMIGVHSWGTKIGDRGDKTVYDGQLRTQRYFLNRMGVDPDFYQFTRAAAGPDDIHWLSVEEMLRYKLIDQDPGCE